MLCIRYDDALQKISLKELLPQKDSHVAAPAFQSNTWAAATPASSLSSTVSFSTRLPQTSLSASVEAGVSGASLAVFTMNPRGGLALLRTYYRLILRKVFMREPTEPFTGR